MRVCRPTHRYHICPSEISYDRMNISKRLAILQKLFTESPITAYRRDHNLQDILVHIKHVKHFNGEKTGTHKGEKKCSICGYINDDNILLADTQYIFKDNI